MLKFSGFADLTSCLGGKARVAIEIKALPASKTTEMASETLTELLVAESPCMLNASGVCAKRSTRHLDTQIRNSCIHAPGGQIPLALRGRDTVGRRRLETGVPGL